MSEAIIGREWTKLALADCCDEIAQRIDKPAESGYERFVGLEHLESGETSVRRWGSTKDVTSSMKLFQAGDVIVARRNVYLRRAARAGFDGVCSGDGIVLRANANVCLPELLPFLLNTDAFWTFVTSQADGTMSKRITVKRLKSYVLALPPLGEQQRIVQLLLANETTVDRSAELVRATQELRSSLIAHHVGTVTLTRATQSTAIDISRPKWEPLKLSHVANVVRGSTPRPARDPRFFGGDHIPWITVGELTKDDFPYLRETETQLTVEGAARSRTLPAGTVVLSNSGFSLGIPKVLKLTGCANDGVAAFLDLDARLNPLFLYYWLLGLTEYLRKVIAAGGDQPNLNTDRIGDLVIQAPPVEEQDIIVELLAHVDSSLQQTRQRTLDARAMSRLLICQVLGQASAEYLS